VNGRTAPTLLSVSALRESGDAVAHPWAWRFYVPLSVAVALSVASGYEGRVRVICFGDVIAEYGQFNSFVLIRTDPAIDATLVPSRPQYVGSEAAQRNMRTYMPRTYSRLVEDYDLILTSDTDCSVFTTEWVDWLARAVTDDGLGLLWLGSIQSQSFTGCQGTTLAEVLPCQPGEDLDVTGSFSVRIVDGKEPLMVLLPWQNAPPLARVNSQVARQGSSLWAKAYWVKEYPLMTYWKMGKGAALCFAGKFPGGVMPWAQDWAFFPEAVIYLAYRTAGRALPRDVLLFRQLVGEFIDYEGRKSMAASAIAFVEQFGGRTDTLYRQLDDVANRKAAADAAYLSADYEASLAIMDEAKADQLAVMEMAMKAKDSVLLWVYITEWCAITATIMVTSSAVWGLMIKRRLYREAGSSRLPRM